MVNLKEPRVFQNINGVACQIDRERVGASCYQWVVSIQGIDIASEYIGQPYRLWYDEDDSPPWEEKLQLSFDRVVSRAGIIITNLREALK